MVLLAYSDDLLPLFSLLKRSEGTGFAFAWNWWDTASSYNRCTKQTSHKVSNAKFIFKKQ